DMAIANHKTYGNHPGDSYIWFNGPQGFTQEKRVDLPTGGPHGLMHQDLGNVYDRSPEENFTSRIFTLDGPGVLTDITWQGDVPAKTWVRPEVRSAATTEALEDAAWLEINGEVAVE